MSTPSSEIERAARRWHFISALSAGRRFRFALHAPDILDLRWSVWDGETRSTVGFGEDIAEAVDNAIHNTKFYVD